MQIFIQIIKREILIHLQRKSEWLAVLLFYVLIASLFPLALGNWSAEYSTFAPIIIWVAVLLCSVLAQENLLRNDFKLGLFDHWLLSGYPFSLLLLAKIITHWLLYALPMVLMTPVLALSFALPMTGVFTITLSVLIGTMFLSLIAALGAALTVSLARGGVFIAMLILPLYAPVLALGSDLGILSIQGIVSKGHLALLLALVILALCGVPPAVAAAIKVSIE